MALLEKFRQLAEAHAALVRTSTDPFRVTIERILSPTEAIVNGRRMILAGTNNYLGLTTHPKLKARALKALERFGVGTGSVRTIAGTMAIHMELERRLAELRALKRELEGQRVGVVRERLLRRAESAPVVAGVRLLAERVDGLGAQETRELADGLRGKLGSGVVVLARAEEAKAALLVAVTRDLETRLPAGDLVRALARIIGGGGGGRPDIAEAGGKSPSRLDEALAALPGEIERRLETKPD